MLVNYTPEEMFALVDAIEAYPEFLPWCGGTTVEVRDEQRTRASILIDYHGVKKRFSTENAKSPPQRIDMKLVEGPFRHLDGTWSFQPLGKQACKVGFQLNYEFASHILGKLVGPVFEHIAATFIEAFVKRAERVYGAR